MRPKYESGLGTRKAEDVNEDILAKLGWKVLIDPNNIWVRAFSDKHLNYEYFLEVKKTAKGSTMWKYILDIRYLIKKGLLWILRMVNV